MKLEKKLFYSKITRRIFILFILCSLVPISILTAVSYYQVTSSLKEQYNNRMQQLAKSVAVTTYERLLLLETNVEVIISEFDAKHIKPAVMSERQAGLYDQWFKGVVHISSTGEKRAIYKNIAGEPAIHTDSEVKNAGKKMVLIGQKRKKIARIYMVKNLGGGNLDNGFMVAELNPSFLWGIGPFNTIPQQTRLFVTDKSRDIYLNPFDTEESLLKRLFAAQAAGPHKRAFSFTDNGEVFFANYQSLFMRSRFISPNWLIVLSQKKSGVLEPLIYFKTVFPLVILLSVWVVLLLSIYYIRKSLVPLEKLKEGTERVAQGDFSTKVEVESDDEFADLAEAFNSMAMQLKKQFNTLSTRAEIDRTILSSLDTEQIIHTTLDQIYTYLGCGVSGIGMVSGKDIQELRYFIKYSETGSIKPGQKIKITPEQISKLLEDGPMSIAREERLPSYLSLFENSQAKLFDIVPAIANKKLVAVLINGYNEDLRENRVDDLLLLSQLVSQMAVALENSRLIDDLEKQGWASLEAFGRAVDAKSSWTAGHSERVTAYAIKIAETMGLARERITLLHRASFLHDIGKIGIPMTILDKKAVLSSEEYEQMKFHPETGANILEPIGIFDEIVPIIRQHHENYDGTGYPLGIKGQEILFEARILRVADVFDALSSVRPYRKKWDQEKIVKHLQDESGKLFDKEVVDILLLLLKEDEIRINPFFILS